MIDATRFDENYLLVDSVVYHTPKAKKLYCISRFGSMWVLRELSNKGLFQVAHSRKRNELEASLPNGYVKLKEKHNGS